MKAKKQRSVDVSQPCLSETVVKATHKAEKSKQGCSGTWNRTWDLSHRRPRTNHPRS